MRDHKTSRLAHDPPIEKGTKHTPEYTIVHRRTMRGVHRSTEEMSREVHKELPRGTKYHQTKVEWGNEGGRVC